MTLPSDAAAAPSEAAPSAPLVPAPPSPPTDPVRPPPVALSGALAWSVAASLLGLAGLGLAWQSHSRLRDLEQELVRRQATSNSVAAEAKSSAQANAEQLRQLGAKLALAEAKLAEVALQRTQLEELLQSFSRSRDENILSDLDAALRLASQQMVLVGSAEPLVTALKQADERLQRLKQPRLEGVRRALLRDLDRLKAVNAVDAGTLALRLDEVSRLVDELVLVSEPQRQERVAAPAPAKPASLPSGTWERWLAGSREVGREIWDEARSLIRVTRIAHPEAMLLTPEQSFLLRENLKLRLLNARLALMSRQADAARADLGTVLGAIERHADPKQRRTQLALELLRQVQGQARPVTWPRPDESLAALAAAGGAVR